MNLFQMERNAQLKNKSVTQANKLANARNNLLEAQNQEMLIREHDFLESQKNLMSQAGIGLSGNRSGLRKRILAEKCKFQNELTDKLFVETVYDIFMESLLLDDDFKETYAGNLHELVESTLTKFMSEKDITLKSLKENGSFAIKNLVHLCEETAKKEADAKYDVNDSKSKELLNEKNKKDEEVKLTDDAKGDFDNEKEFETKSISDAVKEKVVSVVRSEMELAQLDQVEREDIDYEITPEEDHDDMLEEGTNIKDSSLLLRQIRKPGLLQESLFKSLQMNIAGKAMKEKALSESVEVQLDMDLVLAESIAYYTLLETLHTSRIVTFKPLELRSMAKELVFKK